MNGVSAGERLSGPIVPSPALRWNGARRVPPHRISSTRLPLKSDRDASADLSPLFSGRFAPFSHGKGAFHLIGLDCRKSGAVRKKGARRGDASATRKGRRMQQRKRIRQGTRRQLLLGPGADRSSPEAQGQGAQALRDARGSQSDGAGKISADREERRHFFAYQTP